MHDVITKRIALQASAVATGNGTAINVLGYDHVLVNVEGINGDTITFEVTENDTDWYAVKATNMTSGSAATTATADGLYIASVLGTVKFRARVSTYGTGTIIINARAARGNAGGAGGGVSDTELGAATLIADNTATPTVPFVGAFNMLYDGATWDMARGDALNGMKVYPGAYATDDSAMPATPVTLPVSGEYRASATIYTDGDTTVLQSDVNGNTKTTLGTQIAGEDTTIDVLKVEERFSLSYKASAGADQVVKAAAGYLKGIILGTWVDNAILEVSDHASDGDGAVVLFFTGDVTDSVDHSYPKYIPVNASFSAGITADITAFTNVTFIYR